VDVEPSLAWLAEAEEGVVVVEMEAEAATELEVRSFVYYFKNHVM
jgi:hypothetical protein